MPTMIVYACPYFSGYHVKHGHKTIFSQTIDARSRQCLENHNHDITCYQTPCHVLFLNWIEKILGKFLHRSLPSAVQEEEVLIISQASPAVIIHHSIHLFFLKASTDRFFFASSHSTHLYLFIKTLRAYIRTGPSFYAVKPRFVKLDIQSIILKLPSMSCHT